MNRTQSLVFAAAVCAALALVASYKLGPKAYNKYRLHQLQGRQVYDEKADAKALFASELARANQEHKRLLVVLGGNWCQWCLALDDLMHEDPALRDYVAAHYVVLKLDSQAAKPLDDAWGKPTSHGVPVLVFIDDKGAVKHVQDTTPLELWRGRILGHDPRRVLDVLHRWS
jgi:thiol:disulfide interchange protein